ncbi:sigma-70 family RNA polymerase sigma factor [Oerskovia gallyi]|uniref:Sigma-70 family RNA polymerase sigma factor n=1 Tax=Oerskovia gallyi TaxID=2762226 RepID=A0ABR8UZP8_9CELL|nr:sigma-70 family RNA polymerase sigma factor [Oerskovia gallyi]MBD7998019.1 sigma-70 family RNA polymerase sigma factor [Oerskovia gallyi]
MTQVDTSRDDAPTSDAELITAVRAGDYAAFGALYERHAAAARTVARQYVRSGSDADDMVSEAFAKVLGILQSGGGPDVTFRAYLFTVVRRLSYDLSNAGRRTQPTDDIETFESAFGPMASTEDPTLLGFERSVVTKAYQGLPERWQAVLWYTEVEEMNPAQIAPLLGLTANGVSALAYRAREGLRQAYLQQHLTGASSAGCENVNPLLGSYVRGGLAKRETAKVDAHLEECGECRALVLELGDVSHGMRAVIAPLVFGAAGLGLVGTALPLTGGAAVGAGAAGATGAAGGGASGGAGSGAAGASGSGAAGSGAAAGSSGAAAGTGAVGGGAAGTGAMGGAAAAGAAATSGGLGAAAAVGASAAVGTGAAAAAGATGLAAFIAASPLIAAAVGVVAVAAVGAGVVAVSGGFSSDPPPSAGASPDPSQSPSGSPSDSPTGTPKSEALPAPGTDPTSPANTAPLDSAPAEASNPAEPASNGSGSGAAGSGETATTPLTPPSVPLTPVDPFPGAPDPVLPVTPAPPASLDLAFSPLTLAARAPQDLALTASNSGGTSAEEVVVDVLLPPNVSVVTSAVTAGRGVVPAIRLAALPCGPATAQDGGSSLVTCSVGVLAPGEKKDLVITVQASRGGSYTFGGAVHGKGLSPVKTTYAPAPVPSYGAEIDLTTPVVGDLLNPGATAVRLTAHNSGDVDAQGVRFSLGNLPDGVTAKPLTGGWACTPSGGSLTCANDAAALHAPDANQNGGPPVSLDVQLLAGDGVKQSTTGLTFSATTSSAGRTLKDSASADLTVGEPWAGAAGTAPGGGTIVPSCTDGTARIAVDATNTTAYDDLHVTLGAGAVSSEAVPLRRGASTVLTVSHDLRVPAQGAPATLNLETTVDGQTFRTTVDAGSVGPKDCFVPQWLASGDVTTRTVNEAGTIGLEADVTNRTGRPLTVQVDGMTPVGQEASRGAVTIAPQTTVAFARATGVKDLPAGVLTVRQHLSAPDEQGDPGEYDSQLTAGYAAARIAPASPKPTVGQCTYDPAALTSSAPVTLVFDNTASTLAVSFTVAGRDDLAREVAAGASAKVTASVGYQGATFAVSADGRQVATHALPATSCYVPNWSAQQSARSEVVDQAIRIVGTYTNTSPGPVQVGMKTSYGEAKKVEVPAGATKEFVVPVAGTRLPPGAVEFQQSLTADGVVRSSTVTARYEAARYEIYAPTVGAPILGVCFFEDNEQQSYRPVTFVYDNMASTAAVTFHVEVNGVLAPETKRVVQDQKRVQLKVPNVPEAGATYRVVADSGQSWTFEVAGQTCLPTWHWTEAYRVGDRVAYEGRNYTATQRSVSVAPSSLLGPFFWRDESRG